MSQKDSKLTDVNSDCKISPLTKYNMNKNVHSILQHNTSIEMQNTKKFKKSQSSQVVSSDNDILHSKISTESLETANTSKENIFSCNIEFIEKSPSITRSESSSNQPIDTAHKTKKSYPSTSSRSVCESVKFFLFFF